MRDGVLTPTPTVMGRSYDGQTHSRIRWSPNQSTCKIMEPLIARITTANNVFCLILRLQIQTLVEPMPQHARAATSGWLQALATSKVGQVHSLHMQLERPNNWFSISIMNKTQHWVFLLQAHHTTMIVRMCAAVGVVLLLSAKHLSKSQILVCCST